MIKVLFVCHGNICRSPMAEFVFKNMINKKQLQSDFYIASAATSTEEIWNGIGNPVYPPRRRRNLPDMEFPVMENEQFSLRNLTMINMII